MSEKLWVEYKTDDKNVISKVFTEGCKDVDDFIKKIRKSHNSLPKDSEVTLHGPSGTAISVGDSISSLVQETHSQTHSMFKFQRSHRLRLNQLPIRS